MLHDRKSSPSVESKMYMNVVRRAVVYGMETVAVTESQVENMGVPELKMVK